LAVGSGASRIQDRRAPRCLEPLKRVADQPMYLVDAHSAPMASTVSLYHPSDFLRSAAELLGTHCRTVLSP